MQCSAVQLCLRDLLSLDKDLLTSFVCVRMSIHEEDPVTKNGEAVPLKAWSGFQEVKVPRFLDNGTGWW